MWAGQRRSGACPRGELHRLKLQVQRLNGIRLVLGDVGVLQQTERGQRGYALTVRWQFMQFAACEADMNGVDPVRLVGCEVSFGQPAAPGSGVCCDLRGQASFVELTAATVGDQLQAAGVPGQPDELARLRRPPLAGELPYEVRLVLERTGGCALPGGCGDGTEQVPVSGVADGAFEQL